jgi:uridylate kinase
MGMLATVINALAICDRLKKNGVAAEIFSAIPMADICEPYTVRCAKTAMNSGKVLLLAGGTGRAFFSTDSAAALRAAELGADVVVKATKVDGVYDRDPKKYADAKKIDRISFREALLRRISVMDLTAFSLCMVSNIPILVIAAGGNMENIGRALDGEGVGTIISN